MPPQPPLHIGTCLIETIWYAFATRIVDKAIDLYKLEPERAAELKAKFLKRGEFLVMPVSP